MFVHGRKQRIFIHLSSLIAILAMSSKKEHRLVGTVASQVARQNVLQDLKIARNKFTSQTQPMECLSRSQSNVAYPASAQALTKEAAGIVRAELTPSTFKNVGPVKTYIPKYPINKSIRNVEALETREAQFCATAKSNERFSNVPQETQDLQDIASMLKQFHQKLNQRLDVIEQKENDSLQLLMRLTRTQNRRIKEVPKCLPFQSVAELQEFDNIEEAMYDEVFFAARAAIPENVKNAAQTRETKDVDDSVEYFIYLGGTNEIDCAAIYFKCAFKNMEHVSSEITWHGTKQLKALKDTRFAQACV